MRDIVGIEFKPDPVLAFPNDHLRARMTGDEERQPHLRGFNLRQAKRLEIRWIKLGLPRISLSEACGG